MTGHRERPPPLFLDVDGPLLPFDDGSRGERSGAEATAHWVRLDPQMGLRLAALPCDLVWATTWEDEANAHIAPRIGLPQLPVVRWPEPSDEDQREVSTHRPGRALLHHVTPSRGLTDEDFRVLPLATNGVPRRSPYEPQLHCLDRRAWNTPLLPAAVVSVTGHQVNAALRPPAEPRVRVRG